MLLSPACPKIKEQILLSKNETPVVIVRIADPDFFGVLDIRPVNFPEGLFPGFDPFCITYANT